MQPALDRLDSLDNGHHLTPCQLVKFAVRFRFDDETSLARNWRFSPFGSGLPEVEL